MVGRMAAVGIIEFANLNVTYRDPKDATKRIGLLARPEHVLPLFFDPAPRVLRKGSPAVFFIYRAVALEVAHEVYGIAFEFVRVRDLKSHMRYVAGNLVSKERELEDDACSGIGLLVLNDHSLAYVGRTPFSPSLEQLRSTLRRGARDRWQRELQTRVAHLSLPEQQQELRVLRTKEPAPTIDVVRFKAKVSLLEALKEFDVLRRVELQVVAPNPDEIDMPKGILGDIMRARVALKATSATLVQVNTGGLDKDAVATELAAVSENKTTHVTLKGLNPDGGKLTRKDQHVALTEHADFATEDPVAASKPLFGKLQGLFEDYAKKTHDLRDRAKTVFDWLKKGPPQ